MIEGDLRRLKSKAKFIVEDHDELIKYIIETEIEKVNSGKIGAENNFDLTKKYFTNEGIKEGLRRFSQKLNEIASKENV